MDRRLYKERLAKLIAVLRPDFLAHSPPRLCFGFFYLLSALPRQRWQGAFEFFVLPAAWQRLEESGG